MGRHATASIAAERLCEWVSGTAHRGGAASRHLSWAGSVVSHPGAITGPALDPNVWSERWPLAFGCVR